MLVEPDLPFVTAVFMQAVRCRGEVRAIGEQLGEAVESILAGGPFLSSSAVILSVIHKRASLPWFHAGLIALR